MNNQSFSLLINQFNRYILEIDRQTYAKQQSRRLCFVYTVTYCVSLLQRAHGRTSLLLPQYDVIRPLKLDPSGQ